MGAVKTAALPESSALNRFVQAGDFADCYCVPSERNVRHAAEQIVQFPPWVQVLMGLRKIVTAPFGLKNDVSEGVETIGFFPIELETDREIIAGFDDKHLNFRISILALEGVVYMSTWVRPHNLGGRIYLTTVMPFHILICRSALKRLA